MNIPAYPALALVAVIGGFWGWASWQARRFRAAAVEAARRLGGRYEPGTHVSGGTLYGKVEGRDVIFSFYLGSSVRAASTTASALLGRVLETPLRLRGRAAVERLPRLRPFTKLLGPRVELSVASNLATLIVPGVVRDASRLVALASLAAALAAEAER